MLSDALVWLGHLDDVALTIGSLDVLLAPSLEEPFGLIAPEALACEVPVVATRLGGFLTTVQENESGFLVKSRSPGELAVAAARLLGSAETRQQFGKAGRQWVERYLAPHQHFAMVEKVLAKAVSTCRRHSLLSQRAA